MNINIITLFPEIFNVFETGIISKAIKQKLLLLNIFDIRKNSINKHFHFEEQCFQDFHLNCFYPR